MPQIKKNMLKCKYSTTSIISKLLLFITLFVLTIFFFSIGNTPANSQVKTLRRLDASEVLFTVLSIFNYFFYIFFFISFCIGPCFYYTVLNNSPDLDNDDETKLYVFFINKILYIINIGYFFSSLINFINDIEYEYSLSIFICSTIYLVMYSIIYIIFSIKCKEMCFRGFCQWGFLYLLTTAPCCFFAPCEDEECKKAMKLDEDCYNFYCFCFSCCGVLFYLTNIFCYYSGLLIYTLFWLIGKFITYLCCCCDCWCKDDYDINSLFNKSSNTPNIPSPFVSKEPEEEKNAKKNPEDMIPEKNKEDYKKIKTNFKTTVNKIMKISSSNDS